MIFPISPHAERRGFSLIELIAVISILTIVALFAVPAANSVLAGTRLTQATQVLVDQLNAGRQLALAKNRPIEVRFLKYAGAHKLGEPAGGYYRAFQLYEIAESGSAAPIGNVSRLPESIILDSGSTLSSILGNTEEAPYAPIHVTNPGVSLPTLDLAYEFVAFRFQPDGSTNLSKANGNAQWFVTLHEERQGDKLPSPPRNYACVQVEPMNGHIKSFRP